MKTLVLDEMPRLFWQIVNSDYAEYFTRENRETENIDSIIIRTKTKLTAQDLSLFPNLKMIIRAGSGFDNIAVKTALKRGVAVCTTPDANTQAAYEHTLSLILGMIKQQQQGKVNILAGKWKDYLNSNWEISDLKVLLVGVGRIGRKVGSFLQQHSAVVKGVDPYLTAEDWSECKIDPIDYSAGLNWCNLITYHCPLYKATKNYFSSVTLVGLANKIWLVNTARGGIVHEAAVAEGLKTGKILGFGTDVYESEPPEVKEFYHKSNVFLTPHIGASTGKAKIRLVEETIKVWKNFVFEKKIINQIDQRFI